MCTRWTSRPVSGKLEKSFAVVPLKMINRHGWTTVNSASVAYDREACLVDRQQAALTRSTVECNRRSYTVRGLLDAGSYTTVQKVERINRSTKDVVNPVWMLDSDPKEPGQESTTWVAKTLEKTTMPKERRANIEDAMHAQASVSSHPNVCKLKQYFETTQDFFMVTEYCPHGDMLTLINACSRTVTCGGLPHEYVPLLLRQICDALMFCHDLGIIHRDLKCENILLDSGYNVKLSGFHYAFAASRNDEKFAPMRDIRGTYAYSAPEVQFNKTGAPYNGRMADVWSVGVILFAMLNGSLPFGNHPTQSSANQLMCAQCIIFTGDAPHPAYTMTYHLLTYQPQGRPLLSDIINCPWLTFTNESPFLSNLGHLLDNSNSISRDNDLFAETDVVLLPPACPLVIPEDRPPLQDQQKQEKHTKLELLGQRQTPTRGDKLRSTNVESNSHRQHVLKLLKSGVPSSPSRFFNIPPVPFVHDYNEETTAEQIAESDEAASTASKYISMCSPQPLHDREPRECPMKVRIIPPYSAPGICWAEPVVPSNTPCASPRDEPQELERVTARASPLSAGNCRWPALSGGSDRPTTGGRKFWPVSPAATSSILLTNECTNQPADVGGCFNRLMASQSLRVGLRAAGNGGAVYARTCTSLPGQRHGHNMFAGLSRTSACNTSNTRSGARVPCEAVGFKSRGYPIC